MSVKKNIIYKNRGMLLEKIINNTINFYHKNKVALIHKKEIPLKIIKINKNNFSKNNVEALIQSKSTVDYYGVYKSRFICFEAKSTNEEYLNFNNIKNHQHNYLIDAKKYGAYSFYIIYFKKFDSFFVLEADKINIKQKKRITYNEVQKKGIEISINYPGILDFINHVN